jgi:Fic family protein
MRYPQIPPKFIELMAEMKQPEQLHKIFAGLKEVKTQMEYWHWDELKHRPTPAGLNHREWWLMQKIARMDRLKGIPLKDKEQSPFVFSLPEQMMEALHQIDLGAGGQVGLAEPITNPQTRDRYLMSSLIEESITSSQLEGAVTTRAVAKEMIRTGRKPNDASEQMILNNYRTMQQIREWKSEKLTPVLVLKIHAMVTENTMDDPTAAGRLRRADEKIRVEDENGEIFHVPPAAEELEARMIAMCAFANGETPGFFIHPAVRAMILHFWLAYDHPFVDGNGRTARALFYWAMLHRDYWLFEFISISNILLKAPTQYYRSFLYTETDDNDLTYFLIVQSQVIQKAIAELHAYIQRKTREAREAEAQLQALDLFNHRQTALLRHALKNPGQRYTFTSHQTSHQISYQSARNDLMIMAESGLLRQRKKGKQMIFIAPADLSDRLKKLEKEEQGK